MTAPIVFISRFRVAEGRGDAWRAAFLGAVELIAAAKPRTALFSAYSDVSGLQASIVHVFPDAAAMIAHFEGSDDRSSSVAGLITPAGFEIYGEAPAAAVEQLRREAEAAGVSLTLHPNPTGGYLRAPT
jgi:hypothetical protein